MQINKRFSSLRNKLILPFALLGFSVSSVLATITFLVVADLDERNIRQSLLLELEDFRVRVGRNPAALPINTHLIQGYFLPSMERPELHSQINARNELVGQGYRILELTIDGRPRTVLVDEVDGQILALVHNDSGSRQLLIDLAWLLTLLTVFMTVLSALLGQRLAGQVARPIIRLLSELNNRSRRPHWPDEFSPLFVSGEYPRNEIGRLALALDEFAERLHYFIVRERYFVGDVSHELRTPIAIIRGAAEVVGEHPDLPPALRGRIALIQQKAARLGELLDALLQLARENATGRIDNSDALCPISEVIEEAVGECRTLIANKPVKLAFRSVDRPYLPVERSMAYVVVSNLIRNACIHTPGGAVTVTLQADQLLIEDTGVGIDADRFDNIFKRFEKGEASPGSGIGLSIVDRLCSAMGWQIDIASQPGIGTTVALRFTAPSEAASDKKNPPEPAPTD